MLGGPHPVDPFPMNSYTTSNERPTADESFRLWERYKASGDLSLRHRLVLTYVPLVKHIAYKKLRELPACCEIDDLLSCGIEGLIHAIDRYDPSKGAALEPYLWTRIHGSVLDELRRRDWAPRSLRRFERELKKARATFGGAHGRAPTQQELQNSDLTSLSTLVSSEATPPSSSSKRSSRKTAQPTRSTRPAGTRPSRSSAAPSHSSRRASARWLCSSMSRT
jgi:RNA polymerase sigma factor FliA